MNIKFLSHYRESSKIDV